MKVTPTALEVIHRYTWKPDELAILYRRKVPMRFQYAARTKLAKLCKLRGLTKEETVIVMIAAERWYNE